MRVVAVPSSGMPADRGIGIGEETIDLRGRQVGGEARERVAESFAGLAHDDVTADHPEYVELDLGAVAVGVSDLGRSEYAVVDGCRRGVARCVEGRHG